MSQGDPKDRVPVPKPIARTIVGVPGAGSYRMKGPQPTPPKPPLAPQRQAALLVGSGEVLDVALQTALSHRGYTVERVPQRDLRSALALRPKFVVLMGDALDDDGSIALLRERSISTLALVPRDEPNALSRRMALLERGIAHVVQGTASVEETADNILRAGSDGRAGELGQATLQELIELIGRELRGGILEVQAAGENVRISLGGGRPVAQVVQDFVARLRPLVHEATPLQYEFQAGLDASGLAERERVLAGLRILLVDDDVARADLVAEALRAQQARVVVSSIEGSGLVRARGFDPEIVLMSESYGGRRRKLSDGALRSVQNTRESFTESSESPTVQVAMTANHKILESIRDDLRLRWAKIALVSWAEIVRVDEGVVDTARLVQRVAPLLQSEKQVAALAALGGKWDAKVEWTGPARLLRICLDRAAPCVVHIRHSRAQFTVELMDNLVVSARMDGPGGVAEALPAVAALLRIGHGDVHVEPRMMAGAVNLMMPLDACLEEAVETNVSVRFSSVPPPSMKSTGSSGSGLLRLEEGSGPLRIPVWNAPTTNRVSGGSIAAVGERSAAPPRDLRWSQRPPPVALGDGFDAQPTGVFPEPLRAPTVESDWNAVTSARHTPLVKSQYDVIDTNPPAPRASEIEIDVDASARMRARTRGYRSSDVPQQPQSVPTVVGVRDPSASMETRELYEIGESTRREPPSHEALELARLMSSESAPPAPEIVPIDAWKFSEQPPPRDSDASRTSVPKFSRPAGRVSAKPSAPKIEPEAATARRGRSRIYGLFFVLILTTFGVPLAILGLHPEWLSNDMRSLAAGLLTEMGLAEYFPNATHNTQHIGEGERPLNTSNGGGEPSQILAFATDAAVDSSASVVMTVASPSADAEINVDGGVAEDAPQMYDASTLTLPAQEPAPVADVSATTFSTQIESLSGERIVAFARALSEAEREAVLRAALVHDAQNHYAAVALAETLLARNAAAEARPFAELAVQRRPRRAPYRILLSDVLSALGDSAEARAQFLEARDLDPDDPAVQRRARER